MIALAVVVAASQATGAASVQEPVLGFSGCSPVLLVALPDKELTVAFSKIEYDDFGRVVRFVEDSAVAGGASVRAEVSISHGEGGMCPKTTYRALINGREWKSVAEGAFDTSGLAGHIGFTAKDIGGVVVLGTLEGGLKTEFSYDSFGRRQLARQGFNLGGRQYSVAYSAVAFDSFGRLAGYQASLKRSPEQ